MMAVTREIAEREARAMDNAGTDAMVDELIGAAVKERYPVPATQAEPAKPDEVASLLSVRATTHAPSFAALAEWVQALKMHLRDAPGWEKLSADQREALDSDAQKTGRILFGDPNHPDHWLDKEGYARLVRERL